MKHCFTEIIMAMFMPTEEGEDNIQELAPDVNFLNIS